MMICLYSEINDLWDDQKLGAKLQLLPENLQPDVLNKKYLSDRELSITGKLLLQNLLNKFDINTRLDNLLYNQYHKPYFNAGFDFNISHSGNLVICCGTDKGKIGIDIELFKPIDLANYTNYFTQNEWEHINSSSDPISEFYYYWTRKEAVLKAIGTGFHIALDSIDVSGESLIDDNILYHLKALNIDKRYQCHIATTEPHQQIDIFKIE
ncbi:4'-phosphopantetheinyl transferase family protein [Mucilaginibacter sp.]